jgi:hypothetical protein
VTFIEEGAVAPGEVVPVEEAAFHPDETRLRLASGAEPR